MSIMAVLVKEGVGSGIASMALGALCVPAAAAACG